MDIRLSPSRPDSALLAATALSAIAASRLLSIENTPGGSHAEMRQKARHDLLRGLHIANQLTSHTQADTIREVRSQVLSS